MKNAHSARTSFTKKLLLFFIVVALILTGVTVVMALAPEPKYEALNILCTVTGIWFGGTTVFTGFYVWKAKNENRHKYAQAYIKNLIEEYDWTGDTVARILEVVLKGD